MIDFIRKNKFPILLILIGVISHFQWFNPSSILTDSDWYYWPIEPTKQLWYSWGAWLNFWHFGIVNIQIPFLFFNSLWSLITSVGFSFDTAVKITFLIPIVLFGFVSPYYLTKKIVNNDFACFVSAMFYGSSTYFLLIQNAHLPIAFIYAIVPFILLTFLNAFEKNSWIQWLYFILLFLIGIMYEVRMMYIVSFVLIIFVFFQIKQVLHNWFKLFISGIVIVLANIFWVLPTISGGLTESISDVANRGLFGNSFFNISYSLTLHHPFWTGMAQAPFMVQQIPLYFWIIPIMAFIGLYLNRKNKMVLFFGVVALIGIFLSKQVDNPLPNLYPWLFENFPGFNLFREASKFYFLIALGYSVLIGAFVDSLWRWALSKKSKSEINNNAINNPTILPMGNRINIKLIKN